ncbi:MAG: hypothetical protein EA378_03895 [Phycisphaerales bacterium]|nr:MAG: hypothetical protein EA378_03895 [Phycisphaerales bacterium]
MRRVHTQSRPNVALLTEVLRDISMMDDPRDVLAAFGRGLRKLRPFDLIASVSKRGLHDGEYKVTRLFTPAELPTAGQRAEAPDPWRQWDQLPTHTGGFIGAVLADGLPQLFEELTLEHDPVLGEKIREIGGVGSCQAIPAYDAGQPLNWLFRFRKDPRGFTMEEFEQDILTTNLFGGATKNLVTAQRLHETNLKLRDQFQQIAQIQRGLLPAKSPTIPGLSLATSYLTSDQAGGDYYDFFPFADGTWGILIADVSGHGAAAATVMAMLRAILHCFEDPSPSPDAVLTYANDRLLRANLEGSFVTAFFAIYNPALATLTYARCGHNPPRLRKKNGDITSLDTDGTVPLGLFAPIEPKSTALKLEPGDTVVLYTDGITEAFDLNRDMFGLQRLDHAIRHAKPCPDSVIDDIHKALFDFNLSRNRDDDQTIVAFRYDPYNEQACKADKP